MVTVRVEHGDVLARKTDVLVLKYAQALHGVDREASRRVGGFLPGALPVVGKASTMTGLIEIGADSLVLLGVKGLDQFGYAEIREFGRRAIADSRGLRPREVCTTLHGVGYGLDENEAFRAELGGLYDALDALQCGPELKSVTIIDTDGRRVERLQAILRNVERERIEQSRPAATSAGEGSEHKRHAFVAIPFSAEFTDPFELGIRPPLEAIGLLCGRMDQIHFTGDVVATMEERIQRAEVVVADLSGANPNVYFEVGYARGLGRPTILVCREGPGPHFDVRGHRHLRYSSAFDLQKKLGDELAGLGW